MHKATAIMAPIEASEGTVSGEVVKPMIVDGLSPLQLFPSLPIKYSVLMLTSPITT
jgi:hypothetical protein